MKTLKKIICVDDEADIRALIEMCLVNVGGYDVQVYSSGQALLDDINNLKPDLIILDAVMPAMGGLDVLKKIREYEYLMDVAVLFLTGSADQVRSEFTATGAIGVITKPFDPVNLSLQIQAIWECYQNGSDT